jgi:transcriptional regulator with XRE-family HTH domain
MKKQKVKHVLAVIRGKLGISQKSSPDYLGLPVRTLTALECGQLKHVTPRTAQIVSAKTGVSIESLLENSSSPTTADGRLFTRETFEEHKAGKRKPISAVECFRFYLLLCIKLGRVMLAAFMAKNTIFTVWQIRTALNKIGESFPEFESQDTKQGVYQSLTHPQMFDFDMQRMMVEGKTKPTGLWAALLARFNTELSVIEKKSAASNPAKPPRR